MKRIPALFIYLLFAANAFAQITEGDLQWRNRSEGHRGGVAQAGPIDAAIAAYQAAVTRNPDDLEARAKLLRAIRFKGAYVARSNDEKKAVYASGKVAGEAAIAVVERVLASAGLSAPGKASEAKVAAAAAKIPHAGEIYYWDSVLWGEWALAYGKMAALRQGAADRIKREATITMLIDPKLEGAGGARVLGRLHNQTPRVPFVTGWAPDREAVKLLRQSVAADPGNKISKVFLAEAMVAADSKSKPAAIAILQDVIGSPNHPDYIVENMQAEEDARSLLRKWGVK